MSKGQKIMAWIFILANVILAISLCSKNADASRDASEPRIYRDMLTGCEYLTTSHDGALNPRISYNGRSHMGCKGDGG